MNDNERISKFTGVNRHYETDLLAWDSDIYQKIEDADLDMSFTLKLIDIVGDAWQFEVLRSTPAQKTAALSRALQEMEDKG